MAWIFKSYSPTAFFGQITYPHIDYEIDASIFKYFENVGQSTMAQIKIFNTGFNSKSFRIESNVHYQIEFTFVMSNRTPRHIIEQLKSFIRGTNGAGIPVKFQDTFMNGTTDIPITYIGRIGNNLDASDSNILISVLNFKFLVWKAYIV